MRVRARARRALLGIALPADAIARDLRAPRLRRSRATATDFIVTPPSYRFDLAIEEDFVEEVARIHGYDAIPARPAPHVQPMLPDPETQRSPLALKHALGACDWQEIDHIQLRRLRRRGARFDRNGEAACAC